MQADKLSLWLPPKPNNTSGKLRRIGVEIELAGVSPAVMAQCIEELYGGDVRECTPLEYQVKNTRYGDFKLELDASYLKALAEKQAQSGGIDNPLINATVDIITRAAEQLVPWEVVTPPIELDALPQLLPLVRRLREAGALGTRHALHYAFGVHLNPELPDLKTITIVNYLRAYFCLYDWIVAQEQTDLTRILTTYIKHFNKNYIELIIDPGYNPPQSQLIDDYLLHNPTRNRSLDMLPLFAHLDEHRVNRIADDTRIKSRPTFHYRLPNCDIDNPDWNLHLPWRLWLQVEKLAGNTEKLGEMCAEYQQALTRLTHPLDNYWAERVAKEWLNPERLRERQ